MTLAKGLVLLLSGLQLVTGCRETPKARAAELRSITATRRQELERRLAKVDASAEKTAPIAEWIMPAQLREISGLALTSRGTVLAHDDNSGRIYEIDPKTGVLLKGFSLTGNQKEDFEAIAIAGNDIYLMASDGRLFRFREGADGQQVQFQMFDTKLGKECEFESLAYESDSTRLLMACKRILDKQSPKELLIYRLPLPLNRATFTVMRVNIKDVVGNNKWKNFRPSDMTVDPITKNYVVIASHEKGLVVLDPDGEVLRSEALPGDHRQPEGVAITRDSLLMISDESNVKPAALTLYRWRP
ncbi:MAG TPA: SdiA-regulated domain-containing protein [Gemmatimonadaceae bacterium]|nr:SdiA-regulated domain-containing protein [Gemmatimonadaceae bacterium]